jgi:hypothetical protein
MIYTDNVQTINFSESEQEDDENLSDFKCSNALMANYILFLNSAPLLFRKERYTVNTLKCSDCEICCCKYI